jgi:hypothetical protein
MLAIADALFVLGPIVFPLILTFLTLMAMWRMTKVVWVFMRSTRFKDKRDRRDFIRRKLDE